MKTRPLTRAEKTDLQPATDLWRLYRPEQARHRFQACDPAEAERWQRRTRKALLARIGFQDLPAVAPAPRLLERVDKGSYVREKILLRTSPRTVMPVYILLPKEEHDINQPLERALRVADYLECSELMCLDALQREESAGGHFRVEHQTADGEPLRNDKSFACVSAWMYRGSAQRPELIQEELRFENLEPSQRSYK